jgi:hypothetical protein
MNEAPELDAEAVALACSRLALFERAALERVLARGGRARLEDVALDSVVIARLERVLGWFGFERGSPRAGPSAQVVIAPEARDLVASSLAGVPSLRQRPIAKIAVPRLDAVAYLARAKNQGSEALVQGLVARGGISLLTALPRDLRAQALERGALAGLGDVGRLDLRDRGIDLEGPAAVLAPEVLAALAATVGGPAEKPIALAGSLLAVEPALVLAREGELQETKERVLSARARERLERCFPRARLELTPAKDEIDALLAALLRGGLLERAPGGLVPGRAVPELRASAPREQALLLLRAYGATSVLSGLAAREILSLERAVPADLPVRIAALRLVDGSGSGSGSVLALDDALAQAFSELLPAAEAIGLVAIERTPQGIPGRILPTALLEGLRSGEGAPLVVSADGEALVVPGPRATEAAILLGRIGELVSSGDLLRYKVTAATAAAAQASGDDLAASLARIRGLVRGEVPQGFERLLQEAAAGSVRARTRVLHVVEIPRVLAADRAARVLGPLVLDRLTPTLLALSGPLTAASRRALAKEGIFLDEP